MAIDDGRFLRSMGRSLDSYAMGCGMVYEQACRCSKKRSLVYQILE